MLQKINPLKVLGLSAGFFLAILSACQSLPQTAETQVTLPPPHIYVTSRPAGSEVPAAEGPSSTPAASLTPSPFPSTLLQLAQATYGAHLIRLIRIPKIGVLAPVIPVGWSGQAATPGLTDTLPQVSWDSPGAQVGWAISSALPGDRSGNVILFGHNNIDSSVFQRLAELQAGDRVYLDTGDYHWIYQVSQVDILPVETPAQDISAYVEYFKTSRVPRLTLVSCWPPVSNTHRVFVIANPALR
ncbi:MAG TPA: sortase [Anaerolineaceae bacterium]|nr:sortase [Anaerolineaceae bacterium]